MTKPVRGALLYMLEHSCLQGKFKDCGDQQLKGARSFLCSSLVSRYEAMRSIAGTSKPVQRIHQSMSSVWRGGGECGTVNENESLLRSSALTLSRHKREAHSILDTHLVMSSERDRSGVFASIRGDDIKRVVQAKGLLNDRTPDTAKEKGASPLT